MAELATRVLIVAEDLLARAGLASVLHDRPDVLVVGQSAPLGDLEAMIAASRPDVLLWDLGWATEPVLEELMGRAGELPPIVALLPVGARVQGARLIKLHGLLARDAAPETLGAAVQAAAHGLRVMDPTLEPIRAGLEPTDPLPLTEPLTERELEVLRLVAEGLANKAIGARLSVSEHTVKFHLNALLRKLGAQSRTDAVVRATRLGLILL
jgi:DNA-binding NarL/FixJ family response regulator